MDKTQHFKNFTGTKSDRLLIRKLTIEDTEDIHEFTSLPETCRFLNWDKHEKQEVTRRFLDSVIEKYKLNAPSQWAIVLLDENKVIGIAGFINLYQEHSKGELAYLLSPFYQNKGYMTEALNIIIEYGFNNMKLKRIEAKCEVDNFASEKVLQKVGMHLEGCMYMYLFRKGKARDYKFYAILRRDYEKKK